MKIKKIKTCGFCDLQMYPLCQPIRSMQGKQQRKRWIEYVLKKCQCHGSMSVPLHATYCMMDQSMAKQSSIAWIYGIMYILVWEKAG